MGIGVMLTTFVVPILFGLYWKRANRQGVIWSMVTGYVFAFVFGAYAKFKSPLPFHFSFYAFLISILVMVIVSLLTPKPSEKLIKESKTGFFIK
jgi:SSS family solute:Na+ symporter